MWLATGRRCCPVKMAPRGRAKPRLKPIAGQADALKQNAHGVLPIVRTGLSCSERGFYSPPRSTRFSVEVVVDGISCERNQAGQARSAEMPATRIDGQCVPGAGGTLQRLTARIQGVAGWYAPGCPGCGTGLWAVRI